MTLQGCGTMAAVDSVLATAGLARGELLKPAQKSAAVAMKLRAGDELNTASNGKSLSLVVKVYVLRSAEPLKTLGHPQLASPEAEKEAFGEELISVRELVLLPGKSHELLLKLPPDAAAIGVAGLFRAPQAGRWKLAFDAQKSVASGIVIGAHACALTATAGTLVGGSGPESAASLVGVQCRR